MKDNFNKINKELTKQIEEHELKNGKDYSFYINENDPIVHSMKMKGELLKHIELDQEFENADLLDYLGYERIISCKKNNK